MAFSNQHPRALLAAEGFRPRKRLGQHFLTDRSAARRIASLCAEGEVSSAVEIGPGTGTLTAALVAARARVLCVEIDPRMIRILERRADLTGVRMILADAVSFDYDAAVTEPWCACGNLPYNVATALLLRWLGLAHPPARVVVMVQRDVADRLTARVNTPAYGSLGLIVQYSMHVRRAMLLGPEAFYPRPRVDSAVVVMERRASPPVAVKDGAFLLQVVRAGFAYRRKTLVNSLALALGIDRDRTQRVLAAIGFGSDIRAEQLDLDALGAIADRLAP